MPTGGAQQIAGAAPQQYNQDVATQKQLGDDSNAATAESNAISTEQSTEKSIIQNFKI